jgi:hypothetical protein
MLGQIRKTYAHRKDLETARKTARVRIAKVRSSRRRLHSLCVRWSAAPEKANFFA